MDSCAGCVFRERTVDEAEILLNNMLTNENNKLSVILRICICVIANSAAVVETLRAELARAKEQARMSNVIMI